MSWPKPRLPQPALLLVPPGKPRRRSHPPRRRPRRPPSGRTVTSPGACPTAPLSPLSHASSGLSRSVSPSLPQKLDSQISDGSQQSVHIDPTARHYFPLPTLRRPPPQWHVERNVASTVSNSTLVSVAPQCFDPTNRGPRTLSGVPHIAGLSQRQPCGRLSPTSTQKHKTPRSVDGFGGLRDHQGQPVRRGPPGSQDHHTPCGSSGDLLHSVPQDSRLIPDLDASRLRSSGPSTSHLSPGSKAAVFTMI
jgi:hypothetical protein